MPERPESESTDPQRESGDGGGGAGGAPDGPSDAPASADDAGVKRPADAAGDEAASDAPADATDSSKSTEPEPASAAAATPTEAGAEGYPIEAGRSSDAEEPAFACPQCGAPQRLASAVCMRCGWDAEHERWQEPPANVVAAVASAGDDPMAGDASVEAAEVADAKASARPRDSGAAPDPSRPSHSESAPASRPARTSGADPKGDERGVSASVVPSSDAEDDPDAVDVPLERKTPGGGSAALILAGLAAVLLLFAALAGFGSLFPVEIRRAAVAERVVDIGFRMRLELIPKLLVSLVLWALGVGVAAFGWAWWEDRRIDDPADVVARIVGIVTLAQLVVLLPSNGMNPSFVTIIEGVLRIAALILLIWVFFRVRMREATVIAALGLGGFGAVVLLAKMVAWSIG